MKIINNSAVEFFSTFVPHFMEKTKTNMRDDCLRMSLLSEDNARETRCTGKFCPSRVVLITRGRRKKLLLVLRLDLLYQIV